ncbi:TPA: class II fructose-bisphosphate aldolase [Candidatus Poribacteria bacterium]|nr:class II fructose-bisphosphate aldolase [Candidatus Poribacteria bacterium]
MSLEIGTVVLKEGLEKRYAVGAFNANSAEYVQAITQAAEEEGSPVIVQISPGATRYLGLELAVAIVKTAAEMVSIPAVLHLDHGVTYEQNINALKAGFTSLMYDGSELPLEENIKITASIVKEAHLRGVPVEAELGKIPKIEEFEDMLPADYDYSYPPPQDIQEKVIELMAKPEDVERFVEQTGCDSLAAAIGSIHGMKNDVQPLYLKRLREIRQRTDIPIVCHGSSGVIRTRRDVEELEARGYKLSEGWGCMEDAIKEGLVKINIATAVSMSFLRGMKEAWNKNPNEKDSRKITSPGRDAMKETIKGYMRLFGSSGQIAITPKTEELEEVTEGPE